MKITILTLRGPTNNGVRGGAREYIMEISKGLVAKGNQVKIVCGAEPKQNLYKSEIIDEVEVIRVGNRKWSVLSIIKYYCKNLKNDTDILIENMVSFPMYTTLIKGEYKHFTIVHHLTGKEYFKTHKFPIAILGYLMENITLRLMYRKSNFIAVSNHTKEVLINNGIKEKKIDIVNPGIRDNFFVPDTKSKNPEIFFIGRYSGIGGNKKVDHLIEAFKLVQIKIPNAKLIIAGKGDHVEILQEKSIGYNANFIGMISDEEKRYYMQKAWIFASPSLAEGFGITWIEANACGTPVVGYEIEGLNTVNDECSIMVNKNDINSMANAMMKIIKDENLRKHFYYKSIENSNKYKWRISSENFQKIIVRR